MLSCLDESKVSTRPATVELAAYTPKTLISAKAIKAEVKRAGDQGYALVVDEFIVGEVSLGAAATNVPGSPYGALRLSGSSNAWSGEEYAVKFAPFLLGAIAQFERRNPPE